MCGQDENWHGKHMSLILDHKNGINNDHRIENLRIVCPNCNATLDTHGGKNSNKYKSNIIEKKKYYCECGNEKSKVGKVCKSCSNKVKQKVERPSYEQLIKEIEESNYSAVGRKYGVSDSAIRKWKKNYEKKNKKWSEILYE